MVSSLYQDRIQMTAPISHGSSGSPVMDEEGMVLGVASSANNAGENLNFAVPANLIAPTINLEGRCPRTVDFRKDVDTKPKVALETPVNPSATDDERNSALKFAWDFLRITQDGKPFDLTPWLSDPVFGWYGKKDLTIAQVDQEIRDYYKRYPEQTTQYKDGSITIKKIDDKEFTIYCMKARLAWSAANKHERKSGFVLQSIWLIRRNDGQWRIFGVGNEKINTN